MKCYHVDAFAEKVFEGNPAAVCVLDKYPSDDLMLKIAIENNLSETAFAVKEGENYHLRWFTPGGEIDLCGHATLGTSYVLFRFFETEATSITFNTMSGPLTVVRKDDLLEMDFPAYELKEVPVTDLMEEALGVRPAEAWLGRDLVCVLENEEDVAPLKPDHSKLVELDGLLQHIPITASWWNWMVCCSTSLQRAQNMIPFPVPSAPSWLYPKTPSVAAVTVTSFPCGRKNWKKTRSSHVSPPLEAAPCTAK